MSALDPFPVRSTSELLLSLRVGLHTWGRYPFDLFGAGALWDRCDGHSLAPIYDAFQRRFPSDYLHVCEAAAQPPLEGTPGPSAAPTSPAEVAAWIRENRDGQTVSVDDALARGMYAHVRDLREQFHYDQPIFPNQGAPGSGFPRHSWEDQVLLAQHDPDLVQSYVAADGGRFLERVRAAHACGAPGYIFSEGYCGVCDLLSPRLFRRIFLEPKRAFYADVRAMGMSGIGYFLGDIRLYLDTINEMEPDGVLIEESKKGFALDPAEIRQRLHPRTVLFGNLDSYLLWTGPPGAIREEVRRQARALEHGPFVFSNGSPICPGTPAEHLDAFIETARSFA